MRRKDILELRRRLQKGSSTFTNICGCYVNSDKEVVSTFKEFFLNLEEDELFKYLEIAKKVLSGTIGNNLLKLDFPLDQDFKNERQTSLMQLKNSKLKDDGFLDAFYQLVIDHYDTTDNFLIILFHDAYDVMSRSTDNQSLDESEEVYEYILCAICPVSLSDADLTYFEEEDKIKTRMRNWVVAMPDNGFVFPAFIDRGADVNSAMFYTRRPKNPHPELMDAVLGCNPKQTAALQKDAFQSVIKDSLDVEEEEADMIFMDVQENLNAMIDEYNSLYEDVEHDPITLTRDNVQTLLEGSGIPEEATAHIENSYTESFGDETPLAESLIDKKVLKESAQLQKEKHLLKHIGVLEGKLKEAAENSPLDHDETADVVVQVKPEKLAEIKSQIIDGQRCIIIPVNEDEQTRINGLDDLI